LKASYPVEEGEVFEELEGLALEVREELAQLKESLRAERQYTQSLLQSLAKVQQRLREIESSRWWQLQRKYHRFRLLLRTNLESKKNLGWLRRLMVPFTRNGRRLIRRVLTSIFRSLYLLLEEDSVVIVPGNQAESLQGLVGTGDRYSQWRALNMPRAVDLLDYRDRLQELSYLPTISILLPVYNPPLDFFEQALKSVQDQIYPHWELCIADDASTDPRVRAAIARFAENEPRVKVIHRPENGHISAATNSALALATGEFCALLDHDDLLTKDSLYQNVVALNRDPSLDLLYSDEDKVDEDGRFFDPHFKPQWSPDNLLHRNYICHLLVARTEQLRAVEGLRVGFEGAQDFDLVLRLTEKSQRIHHIPRVLYHWRAHSESTAQSIEAKPYARQAGLRAVEAALQRRVEPGAVQNAQNAPGHYCIRYSIVRPGRVSIVIPTYDRPKVLETCLRSIFNRTDYADFEVVVVDNNSAEKETFELLEEFRRRYQDRFRVVTLPVPFNFSRLINAAAAEARGDYLLLLNNDTEVIHADWLTAMVEQAQRPSIGCVGVRLLYPDQTIQHAGVVIGRGCTARHIFTGAHRDAWGYGNGIQAVSNYSAVTAACLMVRREVFQQVGGFDEAFAVDFNDVDFCLRVREAGFHNVYLPHVRLFHHESLTRGHPYADETSYECHLGESRLLKELWQRYFEDDPCISPHLQPADGDLQIRL
jgi:GT2 family glycosyltransferase